MKKLVLLALLCAMSNFGHAQAGYVNYVTSAPSGNCSAGSYQRDVIGTGKVYTCQGGTWAESSSIQSATVTLTAAQLLNVSVTDGNAGWTITPITLVAAPGASKFIVPSGVVFNYKFVSRDYPASPNNLLVSVGSSDFAQVLNRIPASGIVNAGHDVVGYVNLQSKDSGISPWVGFAAASATTNQPLQLTVDQGTFKEGPVTSSTLIAGGTGYAIGDTGALSNSGPETFYQVDTVNGGGAVLTYHITTAGTCYTGPSDTFTDGGQPGAGSGLRINVTGISPLGDGTLTVTAYYTVVTLP